MFLLKIDKRWQRTDICCSCTSVSQIWILPRGPFPITFSSLSHLLPVRSPLTYQERMQKCQKRTETQVHGAHLGTGKFANAWTGREGDRCCDFCVLGHFFSILKGHFSSDTWLVNDINKILFISTLDTLSLHSMIQHSWCYLIHDLTSSCVPVSLLFFLFLLFLFP